MSLYTTTEPKTLSDAEVAKLIGGVVRGMRRRGLPATVDLEDLRQEAAIAVFVAGVTGPASHVARIAKNAMLDYLRDVKRRCSREIPLCIGEYGGAIAPKVQRDPFSALPVSDYRTERERAGSPLVTLASRHEAWERERETVEA